MSLPNFVKRFKKKKKKKKKHDCQMGRLTAEVGTLCHSIKGMESKIDGLTKISENYAADLYKMDMRQKELSLQLDDISEMIMDDGGTQLFIDALLALTGQIESFYLFAQEDDQSPLLTQSKMMWNSAKKSLGDVGIKVIDNCGVPLDTDIHLIKGTGFDKDLPHGYVIKTLESGYVYKGEVIRRASVIVNKVDNTVALEKRTEEQYDSRY